MHVVFVLSGRRAAGRDTVAYGLGAGVYFANTGMAKYLLGFVLNLVLFVQMSGEQQEEQTQEQEEQLSTDSVDTALLVSFVAQAFGLVIAAAAAAAATSPAV